MSSLNDRYELLGLLASGGMASVLYGRLRGPAGFEREVAIKRLHPHLAREPEFLQAFIDEAHICARLSHANIVTAFDVIETPPDLCLVMEYVPGASLDVLLHASRARGVDVPLHIVGALMTNVLHGLHAAHEARDHHGAELGIVHRDVSPSNVLVGEDGVGRVLDFGIARARSRLRTTPGSELKGKFSYMAPELLRGEEFDRRLDVYAAAVVLWEMLAGRTLYGGQPSAASMQQILEGEVAPVSRHRGDATAALDAVVMRGLARNPDDRFASARELAAAVERECGVASQHAVSEWMHGLVGELLARRSSELRRLQRGTPRELTALTSERKELEPTVATRRNDPELLQAPVEPQPEPPPQDSAPHPIGAGSAAPTVPPPARRRGLLAAFVLALGAVVYARVQLTSASTSAAPPVARAAPPPVAPLVEAPQPAAESPGAEPPRSSVEADRANVAVQLVQPVGDAGTKPFARRPVKRRWRPSEGAPAATPDPCANAVQLEMVNGFVVKTYKPECLR